MPRKSKNKSYIPDEVQPERTIDEEEEIERDMAQMASDEENLDEELDFETHKKFGCGNEFYDEDEFN